eukprot:gene2663-2470_t
MCTTALLGAEFLPLLPRLSTLVMDANRVTDEGAAAWPKAPALR